MNCRIAVVVLLMATPAAAQVTGEANVLGSFNRGAIWVDAGVEMVIHESVGVGAELGVMALPIAMGFTLSPRISVRVPTRSFARPFLSAGWPYREWSYGSFSGFYAGGGVDLCCLSDRRSLRVEIRRHQGDGLYFPDGFTTLRFGMTFR